MKIKKFNESIDNKSLIEDYFIDLSDISKMSYDDKENIFEFKLDFDDDSDFFIEKVKENTKKIEKFLLVFERCLKNSELDINYRFNTNGEWFYVKLKVVDNISDVFKSTNNFLYCDKSKLNDFLINKFSSIGINNKILSIEIYNERADVRGNYINILMNKSLTEWQYNQLSRFLPDITIGIKTFWDYEKNSTKLEICNDFYPFKFLEK